MALYASDPGIYGRFGYGIATRTLAGQRPDQPRSAGLGGRPRARPDRPHGRALRGPAGHRRRGRARCGVPGRRDRPQRGVLGRTPRGRPDRPWRLLGCPRAHRRWRRRAPRVRTLPDEERLDRARRSRRADGPRDRLQSTRKPRPSCGARSSATTSSARSPPATCPSTTRLMWLLGDPRSPKAWVKDGLQVRIVDVPAALEAQDVRDADRCRARPRRPLRPLVRGQVPADGRPGRRVMQSYERRRGHRPRRSRARRGLPRWDVVCRCWQMPEESAS